LVTQFSKLFVFAGDAGQGRRMGERQKNVATLKLREFRDWLLQMGCLESPKLKFRPARLV